MESALKVFGTKFWAKTEYDQHFMIDEKILKRIIDAASIGKNDIVLEIGPGNGSLTRLLCQKAKKVIAVEIDKELCDIIRKGLKANNLILVNDDAIRFMRHEKKNYNKIISNLPYMIAEPLFMELMKIDFDAAVFTISKGFAERFLEDMFSGKATKITFLSRAFFHVKKICDVPKKSFEPPPRKGSMVIFVRPFDMEEYKTKKIEYLIRSIFLLARKKLKNALMEAFISYGKLFDGTSVTKNEARNIVKKLGIIATMEKRVDMLTSDDFRKLAEGLKKNAEAHIPANASSSG
ncbi:MAG: ribosomal RNA small subunit methyltransferase A [Candidatus Micrarchaeota archaeon]|nr:ribosomal RNA small subunit methyltransferase A [Candidatus Micrarchaeota archaeon]